jgi:Protein of unknown function (DUF2842)
MGDPIDLGAARSNTPSRRRTSTGSHHQEALIRPRIRKLIGTVALMALVAVWSLLAMGLAQVVLVRSNGLLDFAYYVVAGLGWVPLAMLLVSWMSRGEEPRNKS